MKRQNNLLFKKYFARAEDASIFIYPCIYVQQLRKFSGEN